jgi:hypothetical protein
MPVIRIDDEVWKQLQERAEPLADTPNDVLRRIFQLDKKVSSEVQSDIIKKGQDSIFIIINAIGGKPGEDRAHGCKEVTEQRVNSGVDIQAPGRFSRARKALKPGTRIVMHQGGDRPWRPKYGSAQLVAAGRVKAVGLPLTEEDKRGTDYEMTKKYFSPKPLVGKTVYEFPNGLAKQPLPKEDVSYEVRKGDNFIEIKPDDHRRYSILDAWWKANF